MKLYIANSPPNPTMPAAEQRVLAERYARSHQRRDAHRLIVGNLRLVVKLARELGGGYRGDRGGNRPGGVLGNYAAQRRNP